MFSSSSSDEEASLAVDDTTAKVGFSPPAQYYRLTTFACELCHDGAARKVLRRPYLPFIRTLQRLLIRIWYDGPPHVRRRAGLDKQFSGSSALTHFLKEATYFKRTKEREAVVALLEKDNRCLSNTMSTNPHAACSGEELVNELCLSTPCSLVLPDDPLSGCHTHPHTHWPVAEALFNYLYELLDPALISKRIPTVLRALRHCGTGADHVYVECAVLSTEPLRSRVFRVLDDATEAVPLDIGTKRTLLSHMLVAMAMQDQPYGPAARQLLRKACSLAPNGGLATFGRLLRQCLWFEAAIEIHVYDVERLEASKGTSLTDHIQMATAYRTLAMDYHDCKKYDKSLELFRKCLDAESRAITSADVNLIHHLENRRAAALCDVGNLCMRVGDIDEGRKAYEEAKEFYEKVGNVVEVGTLCQSIAYAYHARKDNESAIKHTNAAVETYRKGRAQVPDEMFAEALRTSSVALYRAGRTSEAFDLAQEAYFEWKSASTRDEKIKQHPDYIFGMVSYGWLCFRTGKTQAAIDALSEAVKQEEINADQTQLQNEEFMTKGQYAFVLEKCGQIEESERLLGSCLKTLMRMLNAAKPESLVSQWKPEDNKEFLLATARVGVQKDETNEAQQEEERDEEVESRAASASRHRIHPEEVWTPKVCEVAWQYARKIGSQADRDRLQWFLWTTTRCLTRHSSEFQTGANGEEERVIRVTPLTMELMTAALNDGGTEYERSVAAETHKQVIC